MKRFLSALLGGMLLIGMYSCATEPETFDAGTRAVSGLSLAPSSLDLGSTTAFVHIFATADDMYVDDIYPYIYCISWPEWMHPEFEGELMTHNISFNAEGNVVFYIDEYVTSSGLNRTGMIVYEYREVLYSIPVTQRPEPHMMFSIDVTTTPQLLNFDMVGDMFTVNAIKDLPSNEYIYCVSWPEWVNALSSAPHGIAFAAQENQVFYCTENTTGAPRTGEIVYEYAQHLYRIPITQNANARLILTPQFLSLTYIQGSTTLNAQAPTNNTIFCMSWPTWMHPVFNNALQPQNVAFNARGNILFYYDQYLNSFNGPRTGEIVYEYGGIQYAVPVTQYPAM